MVLLCFESQMCVLSPLVSDWLCRVSCFYLFLYLIFLFCSNFFFWLLAFFVPLVLCLPFFFFFFNDQIEILFFMHNRYSIRYRYTSILSRFKYQTILSENIFRPGIFTLRIFFKIVTKILNQIFPLHFSYYTF